ncbi:histidine kinase, partial [Candidatus Woesearchaeota archaeon CG_4_10_14_0_8_um_filter_47_5]
LENARLYSEIEHFNQRLKEEIAQATQILREKNVELEKMDQLRSEFVSNVSHEFRTPLTSILGYAKLLHHGKLGPLTPQQKQSLSIILEESERLTRLINSVLDIARLESGKESLSITPVDIVEIAKGAMISLVNTAQEKQIKMYLKNPESLLLVRADNDKIKQVFVNLLSNALKFSPRKGKVAITIATTASENKDKTKEVVVHVVD